MGYLGHIKSKSTHDRRQHATQLATGIVAGIFLVWVTTLGVRLATSDTAAVAGDSGNQTQLANVASGYAGDALLEVVGASTTDETPQ